MQKILKDNIEKIRHLCAKHKVKYLYAFGSVCTNNFDASSDIDLLVSFYPMDYADYANNYFELVEELEKLLDRPVDLITDKSLSNPYFIESVDKTKILIYEYGDKRTSCGAAQSL
ncbi:MAG: nucleotidyltransferase domain-containing protein [Bacteroidales bacterium]|nr:nucleotidyltransferase domain-containing protein [Bacteroidales bacterium]